jgi:GT2 family glycosyltransferase
MTKVFIIIVNFNGIEDTLECLKSVKKCELKDAEYEIVVVDNGSTNNSVLQLRKQKNITLLESKENTGFVGGNNMGIKYALENEADFIMLLNNDTTVKEDLITCLLEVAGRRKEVGIFAPKIYFAPGFEFHQERYSPKERGRVIWAAGGIFDWDNVLGSNYGVDDTDIGQYQAEYEPDFATGACIFVRANVFKKVGLLNSKYFLYLEDVEFCQRAKKLGVKILFIPDAIVWHKVSRSSVIGGQLNDYFISRNRLLFGLRYAPLRAKVALIKESIKLLNNGRPWQRKGVYDFYMGKFGKGTWK